MKITRREGSVPAFIFDKKRRVALLLRGLRVLILGLVIFSLFTVGTRACFKGVAKFVVTVWVVGRDPFGGDDIDYTVHDVETILQELKGHFRGCGVGIIYCLDENNRALGCPDSFSIVSVNSLTVIDLNSNTPLAGLSFRKSLNVSRDFFNPGSAGFPKSEGFFSQITQDIPANIPVDLKFKVTVKPGTTFEKLKSDLKFVVIGTDEAGADEHLLNTERNLFHARSIMLMPTPPMSSAPTLSEWGAIIMTLLLLTAGTVFIVRRRPLMAETVATVDGTGLGERRNQPLLVPTFFSKVLAGILALVLIGFAVVTWLSGPIKLLDIGGTLLCAVIFAYLVQVLALTDNDSHTNPG